MVSPADPIVLFLIQPSAVFVALLVLWVIQSLTVLYLSRKLIFPQLYKFKITELFVAEVSIAIHEMSHLISVVLTGSGVNIGESFINPREGRITATRGESIGGWISSVIAALAPAFLSALIFFAAVVLITQVQLPFTQIYSFNSSNSNILTGILSSITSVILPFMYVLITTILQPNLISIILIYFLIVLSITAGPSEGDWQAAMSILFSPISLISLFALLLAANYVFIQFNINILLPIISADILSIFIVAVGLIAAFILAGVLDLISILGKYLKQMIE